MSAPFYDDVDDGGDDFPPDHFFDGQGEEDGRDDFLEALDAYSSKRELRIGDSSDSKTSFIPPIHTSFSAALTISI
jgi:hypothetical protein